MWLFKGELQVNAAGESWAEINLVEHVRNQINLPRSHDNNNNNNNNNTSAWTEYLIFCLTA